ncbi:MAG: Asp23/Gls24 family envelope stress response protein [Actinomycetota bacterium]|nr:Asp23/Gls24 family envelope stress response protein [Actinomycetota bacterium]
MTETPSGTMEQAGSDGPPEAGRRGRLDIAGRAIERIATHAAQTVTGVTASGSGLERMVGRGLPRASSTVAGDTVRLSLDISLTWPVAAGEVTRQVRSEVAAQVGYITGLSVAAVDVTIAKFEPHAASTARRVQ